jgi:hypothetical protein
MTEERTPKNAPGPFYVAKDECIACRAPEVEARGLMSFDDDHSSCFFERQPMTPEEEYRAIRAIGASCCGAVRYGGSDPDVIARLARFENGRVATTVTFAADSVESAANLLRRIGENMTSGHVGSTVGSAATTPRGDSTWLIFQWPGVPGEKPGPGVKLTLSSAWDGSGRRSISIDCGLSIQRPAAALQLSDALEKTSGLADLRWYQEVGSRHWETLPV